jgi:hypothetical protein
MTNSEEQKRLRRNNILLAIILGIIAVAGTLIPYYYLQGLAVPG